MENKIINLVKATPVGIGPIMRQDNGWTGLLLTAGLLYIFVLTGILFTLGAPVGTLTACGLKYDRKDIRFGLHGFNGAPVCLRASV